MCRCRSLNTPPSHSARPTRAETRETRSRSTPYLAPSNTYLAGSASSHPPKLTPLRGGTVAGVRSAHVRLDHCGARPRVDRAGGPHAISCMYNPHMHYYLVHCMCTACALLLVHGMCTTLGALHVRCIEQEGQYLITRVTYLQEEHLLLTHLQEDHVLVGNEAARLYLQTRNDPAEPARTVTVVTAANVPWLAAAYAAASPLQKPTCLRRATFWAREECPHRVDAEARLLWRSGACPQSPTPPPLLIQVD